MKIGLTYDLRSVYLAEGYSEEETAEFDRDDTIDALEAALQASGHGTERIGHARQLMAALLQGRRWDLVFNIAEGMNGIAREAQIPAILDIYNIPYTFSDATIMALALHKGLTKAVLQAHGIKTPPFKVVDRPADLGTIALPFPLFAKPVAEGTGKGISPHSKIKTNDELLEVVPAMLRRYRQPVLLETYLPGREFTVGLLGTGSEARVLGTMEILLRPQAEAEVYSYTNKERCEELVDYVLVGAADDSQVYAAEKLALEAWRVLGCRDAGRIDLRCDAQGEPSFMEVNPLAGLHPEHSDLPILCAKLKIPYPELIRGIVASASARLA